MKSLLKFLNLSTYIAWSMGTGILLGNHVAYTAVKEAVNEEYNKDYKRDNYIVSASTAHFLATVGGAAIGPFLPTILIPYAVYSITLPKDTTPETSTKDQMK